ncbi:MULTISPECIES: helicase C-terminal domain-containing protein [unclassified Microbacterium]|uniref:helicase C-terminal domain-containing protein n=1 Tax=unclassified Microbacterium TaxID=2609290 RepID=UPI0010F653B2|nr:MULTISPECIES: helicase C-terminal domain-containing protein [unclassified Microbacterium]
MTKKPGFNFGKLTAGTAIRAITEPTALFDALPNKETGYGYLRAVQGAVLDAWYPRRTETDLVIKTNTGGGKTIVGLLMLQSALHEGMGPALYVAPDPHLAERVEEEARALGLAVVTDPEHSKFTAGEAICVTTMQTLMNAKTRFGIEGSATRQPIPVGTIVIDDAHAALAIAEEAARLAIPATHAVYKPFLDLFEEELKTQGLNAYLDIRDGDRSAVLRVPFWAWIERQEQVLAILRPHRATSDFEWSWPVMSDLLAICEVTISAEEIEIKPPCTPVEKFPSFAEAKRRIYMTATLADDSLLVTHFDANPDSVANSIVPDTASDLGDRLVLAPQELNPTIKVSEIRELAGEVAEDHNVVVLVPSWRLANEWSKFADTTVSKPDDISAVVAELRAGHVGLVVIVGRYDGIDLPDDACRLLVIDSLPFAYTGSERREAIALRDSEAMVARQLERLEQGIGRGVRSRDDRCAVVLIGPRLTQLVARADVADRLSPATRAQLKLSRTIASDLDGATVEDIEAVVRQVIGGDADFRTLSREALLGVKYDPGAVSDVSRHLRAAYNSARAGRYEEGAEHAGNAVDAAVVAGDTRLAGWLGETHAAYLGHVNGVAAQLVLDQASRNNPAVLTPLAGIDYEHLGQKDDQAQQAKSFLSATYANGAELIVGIDALITDLAWDPIRTDEAEDALASLGQHLGFLAQQPERDFKIGSDVMWSIGMHRYVVIEAKTGATANVVWKKDINQLAGSANWAQGEYGADATVIPVVVHPSHVVERAGTPPHNCHSINRADMKELKKAMKKFARALAQDDGYKDATAIGAQLSALNLTADGFFQCYTRRTKREPRESS